MSATRFPATAFRCVCARVEGAIFANFVPLLLIVISLSQACVLSWLFPALLQRLPPAGWMAGLLVIYGLNRWAATRARRQASGRAPVGWLLRLYDGVAFTCLFCMSFLILTGALWIGVKIFLGAIAVEARTVSASLTLESGLDTGFRWLGEAGIAAIAIAFTYGYSIGQRQLRITRVAVPLRNAPVALNDLRIAHISDIHIGMNLTLEELAGFVARVNELQPDLICITGDIVDGSSADLEHSLPVLDGLQAPHGVLAILGNHDHYAGAERVEGALRRWTRVTVLRDQHTTLQIDGQPLHIIGLDDRGRDWARGQHAIAYLDRALDAIPPTEPIVLLCHRPDIFPRAAAEGVALMLSGHTHGGQLGVPWLKGRVRNLAELITSFDRGLFDNDGAYLYVNCGLGVTLQRIRLCTPREITIIQVQAGDVERHAA